MQTQDASKQKTKKKKIKKPVVSVGGGVSGGGAGDKHWNELFQLPEREGMVGETDVK